MFQINHTITSTHSWLKSQYKRILSSHEKTNVVSASPRKAVRGATMNHAFGPQVTVRLLRLRRDEAKFRARKDV